MKSLIDAVVMDVQHILRDAFICLKHVDSGERIDELGIEGFGALEGDTELVADKEMGEFFKKFFLSKIWVRSVTIEGLGTFFRELTGADDLVGSFDVYIDPLDGSLNFKTHCYLQHAVETNISLPYTAAITVVKACEHPKFSDIVVAGISDLRKGDTVIARCDNTETILLNGYYIMAQKAEKVDPKNQILIWENYYPDNRDLMNKAFKGEKGWFRNPGSAAYEMMLVAVGIATAFLCCSQKMHELGAGYLLVTCAGGAAFTFEGKPLGEQEFEFNKQISAILACTEIYGQELVNRINS